jgi:ParB-like nuclease domain
MKTHEHIRLKDCYPNPFRDHAIDPVDSESLQFIRASIRKHKFWGGSACRRVNGRLEVASGWTRMQAAIKEGVEYADIYVGDFDDHEMIQAYAKENATQRGNSSTALVGSIASTIKYLARVLCTDLEDIARILAISQKSVECARGNLLSGKGIGHELIEQFLADVPHISESTIKEQLATLKASGHYDRLIAEAAEEVEAVFAANQKAELARLEAERKKAEKAQAAAEAEKAAAKKQEEQREAAKKVREAKNAAEAAAAKAKAHPAYTATRAAASARAKVESEEDVTFDYTGVVKYLQNDNQIKAFRDVVKTPAIRKVLPVENQAALAAELVKKAREEDKRNITAEFIRQHVVDTMLGAKLEQRKATKEELKKAEQEDAQLRFYNLQHHFSRQVGGISGDAVKMLELMEKHREIKFVLNNEFKRAVRSAYVTINKLAQKLNLDQFDKKEDPTHEKTVQKRLG